MFNLDQALEDWRRQMIAGGLTSPEALDELESHLRDDVQAQVQSGMDEMRAFGLAVARLGAPRALIKEFLNPLDSLVSRSAPFSDAARRALENAREEALMLGHDFIGTEHVLLGVLRTAGRALTRMLESSRIDSDAVREEVSRLVSGLPARPAPTAFPLTPRARRALRFARQEARALKQPTVETEHILLGLVREGEGLGAAALRNLGVRLEVLRTELTSH